MRWIGLDAPAEKYDIHFLADDFGDRRDLGDRSILVACRSDPPPHTDFDELIFLSAHHAKLMGHPGAKWVGGGVDLADYTTPKKRLPRRVISTSSPDRCPAASVILQSFDGVHTYRPVGGVGHEYTREELINIQQTAMVHAYPLDPRRPSDFFSMSVLESMAAGTPVVVSDADSMVELWGEAAWVLPRPIRLAEWHETIDELLSNGRLWTKHSQRGLKRSAELTWAKQAGKYLAIAMGD